MLMEILFYLFGLLGLVVHFLFKFAEKDSSSPKALLAYAKTTWLKGTLSFLTYSILYVIWAAGGYELPAQIPRVLSPILAYISDSLWIHTVNLFEKRVGMA